MVDASVRSTFGVRRLDPAFLTPPRRYAKAASSRRTPRCFARKFLSMSRTRDQGPGLRKTTQ
jgi:hypothetical protein